MITLQFPSNPALDEIFPTEGTKQWQWNGIGWVAFKPARASDAQLRDRVTHTGTQAIATIEGLEAELAEKLESVSSETISDATAVGKALITTADAAAARTSLGVTTAANGAHTGTTTFQVMAPDSINETAVALGAGVNIDLSAGSYFSKTITAVTTFTRSNVPASGRVGSFTLELTNGGNFTVNWFAGVKWDGGTQPALTANGIDILAFITRDGGTTWRGVLNSKDSK